MIIIVSGINRIFYLPLRNFLLKNILLKIRMKDYNVMINGKNIFDQPVENDLIKYDNIQKIKTGQRDD